MAKDNAIKTKEKPKTKPKPKAKDKASKLEAAKVKTAKAKESALKGRDAALKIKADSEESPKAKVGRPTNYRDEHCALVIELMKEGASKAEVCLNLDCSFQTFLTWQAEYPEFLEAVKRGSHLSKGKWESMGRKAAFGDLENFNATAWIFNMKNRFGKTDDLGEKWSDKQEIDHNHAVSSLSDEELDSRVKALTNAVSD